MNAECSHDDVAVVNPYELIRKYRCRACAAVMMCTCDERLGRRVLPHQTQVGTELRTRRRVPVTVGFVSGVCSACRGLPEQATPKTEGYGRTSKFARYYWRELQAEALLRFATWCDEQGIEDVLRARAHHPEVWERIERAAHDELRERFRASPKYVYARAEPTPEFLARCQVAVVDLRADYVKGGHKGAQVVRDGHVMAPEDFARDHLAAAGWEVMPLESRPIHALYAHLMWPWVQDPRDPLQRSSGFGRPDHKTGGATGELTWTMLPADFGTPGHAQRRARALTEHLQLLQADDLAWLFEYWHEPSRDLAKYLWAGDEEVTARARHVLEILPHETIVAICQYLAQDYWKRYLGWPDLLVCQEDKVKFVEVKSGRDRLSEDQRAWFEGNAQHLRIPAEVIKIHRSRVIDISSHREKTA